MKGFRLLACLLAAAPARAGETAQSAFETFKHLQGEWTIVSAGRVLPIRMTYDVASKGSIVTEQFGKEFSVFSRDGDALLMTHYCNAGNQPHLRLKLPVRDGVFDFTMTGITGLGAPDGAHVHEIIYHVADPRTVTLRIIWTGQGTGAPEDYTLRRGAAP